MEISNPPFSHLQVPDKRFRKSTSNAGAEWQVEEESVLGLRTRTRLSKSCTVVGYLTGQDGNKMSSLACSGRSARTCVLAICAAK